MNPDRVSTDIRKFLRTVGVTSQREIETSVQKALAEGRLRGDEKLHAKIVLTVPLVGLAREIAGVIDLE